MTFPELAYLTWAKTLPKARVNLARSGIEHCPASLLCLDASDLVTNLPVQWGYPPLLQAIAARYRVSPAQVFTASGGTSLANWLACAAALEGARRDAEVIVERPTYEPLLRLPEMFGGRIRRLDRRFSQRFAIDLDRLATMVTSRTKLAVVSNFHNPSGARIDAETLGEVASLLARVGATLLVDEVYLECEFGARPSSCVHAGPNVVTTNSLTKAYGLDGLRAGWLLGPPALMRRAALIHDLLGTNGVAPGEQMQVAAFERLPALRARAHALLDPNLERIREFFATERRLQVHVPEGGNVVFPRLPEGLSSDRFADHLRERYSTLVVPGRFFESPRHIRISFGMQGDILARGLRNISRALDDLGAQAAR
jgi:aspartate/methionine/tyrosine aminotransferase